MEKAGEATRMDECGGDRCPRVFITVGGTFMQGFNQQL
jgi:hypothetical protein